MNLRDAIANELLKWNNGPITHHREVADAILRLPEVALSLQRPDLYPRACTSPEGGPCGACGAPTLNVERVTTYRCRDHLRNPRPEMCGDCAEDADVRAEKKEEGSNADEENR